MAAIGGIGIRFIACALALGGVAHAAPAVRAPVAALPLAAAFAPAPAPLIAVLHPGPAATALVRISPQGEVGITLRHDAIAFALDETPQRIADAPMLELLAASDAELDRAFADARERFATLCELEADGVRVPVEVLLAPTTAEVRAWQKAHGSKPLPVKLDFVARARLPIDARTLSLRFPEVLGDLLLTVDRPGEEPLGLPLAAGEVLADLGLQLEGAPAGTSTDPTPDASAAGPSDAARHATRHAAGPAVDRADAVPRAAAHDPGTLAIAWRYVALGFTHILPLGLDHVLFVLGLFLLSAGTRPLLLQVTAFTLAHSITLALSMFGLVSLPAGFVEPAIAASIAFVACENLATERVRRGRVLVVFAFGLVHGLGFAGVLRDLGLPRGQLAAALVSFNAGVEFGQLAVIALALCAVGWWRTRAWYRRAVVVPASLGIAAVGALWTIERLLP